MGNQDRRGFALPDDIDGGGYSDRMSGGSRGGARGNDQGYEVSQSGGYAGTQYGGVSQYGGSTGGDMYNRRSQMYVFNRNGYSLSFF